MREIVTVEQVNTWFILLSILLPVLGMVIGGIIGYRRNSVNRSAISGFLIGLVGPLNLVAWKVYNVITDRLGLDTVKNLLVQLAMFVVVGALAGFLVARFWRNPWPETGPTPNRDSDTMRPDDGGSTPVAATSGSPRGAAGAARTFEEAEEPPREP